MAILGEMRCDKTVRCVLLTVVRILFLCARMCVCVRALKSDGARHHSSTDSEMQSLAALFLEFQFLSICVDVNMPGATAKHVSFFSASSIEPYGNRRLIAAAVSLFLKCVIAMHRKVSQLKLLTPMIDMLKAYLMYAFHSCLNSFRCVCTPLVQVLLH